MKSITYQSLFELKSLANPKIANNRVFFIETKMREEENDYFGEIKSIDLKTKEIRTWSPNFVSVQSFDLSPDKRWLTFIAMMKDKEKRQLFVMPMDGGSPIQLTNETRDVYSFYWHKENGALYFQVTKNLKDEEESENKHPQPNHITEINYKNDGMGLKTKDISYLVKRVEMTSKQVTEILDSQTPMGLCYVSNDEQTLYFNQSKTHDDDFAFAKNNILVYDVLEQSFSPLTTQLSEGTLAFEASNEAETHFLLSGHDFKHGFVTQTNLFDYNVKEETLTPLTAEMDVELGDLLVADFQQAVSGIEVRFINNEEFVFSTTEQGTIKLYRGNLNGKIETVFEQSIHITSGSFESDQWIVTYSTPIIPSRLALINEAGQLVDLYNPNAEFEANHQLVDPERFWYKGYDDWSIQGWYLKPNTSEQHPAILYIHGGPQVAYGESFFHEMQSLVQAGYGVIMLNPRGGNSYGQAFVASILGDYGNHDFDDLMLGVDHVLAQHPEIDEQALYVAGGSYGGFMTNWIVGHTDRFKAAVSQRSISNWISFYGTSDIGMFFVEYQLQNDLSNVQRLWEMSPLAHAHQASTPILFLHGESDLRCPQEQAEQMYIAMKKARVETELITYPQSSHGLSREGLPNLRIARLEAIKGWFDKH